jgi:hypothetical protein
MSGLADQCDKRFRQHTLHTSHNKQQITRSHPIACYILCHSLGPSVGNGLSEVGLAVHLELRDAAANRGRQLQGSEAHGAHVVHTSVEGVGVSIQEVWCTERRRNERRRHERR